MWLAGDERRLLAGLYRLSEKPGTRKGWSNAALGRLLGEPRRWREVRPYGQEAALDDGSCGMPNMKDFERQMRAYVDLSKRVDGAVTILKLRNLIQSSPHENVHGVIFVELTVEGFDLGRNIPDSWNGQVFGFASTGIIGYGWCWPMVPGLPPQSSSICSGGGSIRNWQ